jgi:hypothetical protein
LPRAGISGARQVASKQQARIKNQQATSNKQQAAVISRHSSSFYLSFHSISALSSLLLVHGAAAIGSAHPHFVFTDRNRACDSAQMILIFPPTIATLFDNNQYQICH